MSTLLVTFLATYLIAAIPAGYWMGLAHSKDLTQIGSGSTGATNVLRSLGKWQALLVLLFDIGKGFAPIYYAKNYVFAGSEYSLWWLLALTFIPMLAHAKSVYIGFKGGKSSATGCGILIALNPLAGLITFATWFTAVKISNISSMGSIVCIPLVAPWLWFFGEPLPVICFGIIAFIYIVLIKHRSNIKRLLDGTEPKIGLSRRHLNLKKKPLNLYKFLRSSFQDIRDQRHLRSDPSQE